MESIGLNSEVLAAGKKLHIQTNFLEPVEKIVSNIFDDGKVLLKKEIQIENKNNVKKLISEIHKEMVAEIELLIYISEKVRSVRHAISNNKLGLVFYQYKLYEEAINEFKTAIEIDPDFAEAYKNLGIVYLTIKKYDEALDVLKIALNKQPNYPDFHNALGQIYLAQQKYIEALAEFNFAIEKNQNYAEAHFNLVLLLLKSIVHNVANDQLPDIEKRKEMAITHLQKAESFIKSDSLIKAYEYFDNGDIEQTLSVLERVKEESYEALEANIENDFYLKFMFGGKGKDDPFISNYVERLKETIKKYPKFADLRNHLGIAYLIQCRNLFLNALDEFRQSLEINPNYKKAGKNLKLAENDGKGFLILLRAILK